MSDIAHELKVRPAAAAHNNRITVLDGPYVLLSPQERDEVVSEIEKLRRFLELAADAYEDLNDNLVEDKSVGKPGHFLTHIRRLLAQTGD